MTLHDDVPTQDDPSQKKGKGCLFVTVSVIVIASLLATSAASLIWFWAEHRTTVSEAPVSASIVKEGAETVEENEPVDTPDQVESVITDHAVADDPVVNPRLNRIVIVNEERQIETVAPDGGQRHRLTDDDRIYDFPTWAPGGSQIAVVGSNQDGGTLFLLQDQEGSGPQEEIYSSRNQPPFYLYWSPDGKQISFLTNNPTHGIGLNVVNTETGDESREIASGSPFYWNWTADSKQILIHSGLESEASRLVLIDDAGHDQTQQIPAPGYFQAPGISPSGRYWAYSQLREGGNTWVTIDDRSNDEQTAERHAGAAALNWSPAADQLAFISGEDDGQFNFWGPLRLIDMKTGETRLLSSDLVLAFFWSPDGKQILTISAPTNGSLEGDVEVRETKRRHLARIQPQVQPVQRVPHQFKVSVINVEDGSGLELAEVGLSPAFLAQFLVYFDQYSLSHSLWSPDSKQFVLPIISEGENQIVVISSGSGRLQQIANGYMAFWSKQ